MLSMLFAYILIVFFFAIEGGRMRKGQEAKTFDAGQFDGGSSRLLFLVFFFNVVILIIANAFNFGQINTANDVIGWIGIAIMCCGIMFQVWASQTLGKLYTRTLLVTQGHAVVQRGPYKAVRHPGYLGLILMWAGAGLATVNWIAAAIVTLTMVAALRYRINCEETMLVASFGQQYTDYVDHTWRLLPFIW
jgi:protein-S-isoprenylcysteine O-methyltransferase Ste14